MYENIAKALKARLYELMGRVSEIDSELRKPLSADSEERATDLENQEALEAIENSEMHEIHQIQEAFDRSPLIPMLPVKPTEQIGFNDQALPVGCEAVGSPLAHSRSAHIAGRCLS
jgi:hypothetical protein